MRWTTIALLVAAAGFIAGMAYLYSGPSAQATEATLYNTKRR